MNLKTLQQDLDREFDEYLELGDALDIYQEDYAQQLLEDDALETAEVAFLKGYRDFQL
ncbi:hypothetical protein JXA48_02125 [Candidatus Woesearchaeota archaeon]|nr:hypothetical protein [Candidatus Woesearchaeota archaeon]